MMIGRCIIFIIILVINIELLIAQAPVQQRIDPYFSPVIQSGPMAGYATFREVMLWVQTKMSAKVKFRYWDEKQPQRKYWTTEVQTVRSRAFTAHVIADTLQPGKKYQYEVWINGRPVRRPYPLRFQTPALLSSRSPADVRIALGSCVYVNDPVYEDTARKKGGNYEILQSIAAKNPQVMLWTGDNVYTREPDWSSRTGYQYRYTHTRSIKEMQPLLGICNHYAIWDDHDYGPGDANRAFYNKALGLETFQLFWANPTYGISPQNGITSYFSWSDTEFYLMDNRWFRTDKNIVTSEKVILGDTQIRWLIENLKNSRATFKFVVMGGQFLCAANEKENYINYPEERERILNALEKEGIKGVIFITGDRHFTELSRYVSTSGQVIYDLTVSPLTNNVHKEGATEFNALRVENTLVMERNFGLLEVSGPEGNRQLKITIYNVAGKEIWSKTIPAGELYTRENGRQ